MFSGLLLRADIRSAGGDPRDDPADRLKTGLSDDQELLRRGLRLRRMRSKRRSFVCSCSRSSVRVTVSWLTCCDHFPIRLTSQVNAFIAIVGFHFRLAITSRIAI